MPQNVRKYHKCPSDLNLHLALYSSVAGLNAKASPVASRLVLCLDGIHHSGGKHSIGLCQVIIVGSVCARKVGRGWIYVIFHYFHRRKRTKTAKTAARSSSMGTTSMNMTMNATNDWLPFVLPFPPLCEPCESVRNLLILEVWRKANMNSPLIVCGEPIARFSCRQPIVSGGRLAVPLPSPGKCRSFPLFYLVLTLAACARP